MDTVRQMAVNNKGDFKQMTESAQAILSLACELFITEVSLKCREYIDKDFKKHMVTCTQLRNVVSEEPSYGFLQDLVNEWAHQGVIDELRDLETNN